MPHKKVNSVHTIEFQEKSKRRHKEKMRDQVFIPLPEPLADLFHELLAVNLIAKLRRRGVPNHFSKYYDPVIPNVSTILVKSGMIGTVVGH